MANATNVFNTYIPALGGMNPGMPNNPGFPNNPNLFNTNIPGNNAYPVSGNNGFPMTGFG